MIDLVIRGLVKLDVRVILGDWCDWCNNLEKDDITVIPVMIKIKFKNTVHSYLECGINSNSLFLLYLLSLIKWIDLSPKRMLCDEWSAFQLCSTLFLYRYQASFIIFSSSSSSWFLLFFFFFLGWLPRSLWVRFFESVSLQQR